MLQILVAYWWILPVVILAVILLLKSFVNVKSNQIAVIEHKYFGREMADGRTVALKGEVGIRAEVLGPGLHLIIPFVQKAMKYPYTVIGKNEIGIVEAITGKPIPKGHFMARSVECDTFQDGEAFLKNGGQKGPQVSIIPPGEHRINPYLFKVKKEEVTVIRDNQVGLVESIDGKPIEQGHVMAKPVDCNLFQDGEAFLNNDGEKGLQVDILPPGIYRINTSLFHIKLQNITVINTDEVGVVESIDGKPVQQGRVMAEPVDCNLFQDGRAFLANGGQKGPQIDVLTPGFYRINTYLFNVSVKKNTIIKKDEVGLVKAIDGLPIPVGRIMAEPVVCNLFQDGRTFLANGGQKGPQIDVLTPGVYRINPYLFEVNVVPMVHVPSGKIVMVTAMDGAKIEDGRILGKKVEGHSNFEKGSEFIKNFGEKGRQLQYLMPGNYRINTYMFHVSDPVDWVTIDADHVGVVTTLEGKPITDTSKIAACEIPLDKHSNFQDPAAFLAAGGEKGLQIPVLRAGSYAINPWFAVVDQQPMVNVAIGECAVVTSFVGEDYKSEQETLSKEEEVNKVNAKLVPNGFKGIWNEPLGPGKHALNPKTCGWNIVPTIQVVLSWDNATAEPKGSTYQYDENLRTIVLRTADAFDVSMDVQVMFHIPMEKAPAVVADLGSMQEMISQVLEPAVSSHFRNAAQTVNALDLYTKRAELAAAAKVEISGVLERYHIESRDVMITDVVLPEEIIAPVKAAAVADQEKIQYQAEQKAQDARKQLEFSRKQADMQEALVESERGIDIADNNAKAAIKKAEGEKQAGILAAEGEAKTVEIKADAAAHKVKIEGEAEAAITKLKGEAEGSAIEAKGLAQAEAFKKSQEAFGEGYTPYMIAKVLADGGIKIIPDVIFGGSGEGAGSLVEKFFATSMLEKLVGKPLTEITSSNQISPETPQTPSE